VSSKVKLAVLFGTEQAAAMDAEQLESVVYVAAASVVRLVLPEQLRLVMFPPNAISRYVVVFPNWSSFPPLFPITFLKLSARFFWLVNVLILSFSNFKELRRLLRQVSPREVPLQV